MRFPSCYSREEKKLVVNLSGGSKPGFWILKSESAILLMSRSSQNNVSLKILKSSEIVPDCCVRINTGANYQSGMR
ncbi:MAG: hypothetical protein HC849_19005 [Oscillatoriales cyanobacterium RU_3_3]|nr:hypothetical protein [Oscillatoriales cyanobacterium RU_3_3]